MSGQHVTSLQLVERYKTLFNQLQKLTNQVKQQNAVGSFQVDPKLSHLQRHIFHELIDDQPIASPIARDDLTGLLMRSTLVHQLDCELKKPYLRDNFLAVCFIDLDGFKEINDQYGHAVGDQLLGMVGASLEGSIRSEDLLCRWGGDEFVVVFLNIDREESVVSLANRLHQALSNPFRLSRSEPLTLFLTASIGIAAVKSTNLRIHTNALAIIEEADHAMYSAKRAGKNQIMYAVQK